MSVNLTPATLAAVLAGGVFIYSGVKGPSVASTVRSFIANGSPPPVPAGVVSADPSGDNTSALTVSASAGGTASSNQAIGKLLASQYGWSDGNEWQSLVQLWTRESSWNNKAKNASSGAYGIAQALPESKYPPAGQESGGSSAAAQIQWGLNYIKSRYGTPSAAWAHETANSWY